MYLEFESTCVTCYSLFLKHSYDPLRYTELDLQPFWTSVSDRLSSA